MFIWWEIIPGAAWVKLEKNDLLGSEIGYAHYGQQVDNIAECLTWCLGHGDVSLTHRNERNPYELNDGDEGKWQTLLNCENVPTTIK